jgi:hypothetical protein
MKTLFSIVLTLAVLYGCTKPESVKHIKHWKGTWLILESTDLPNETGTKSEPLGVMKIDEFGYGTLEYMGQTRDFVLHQTTKTTPSYPFQISFLKGGGGLDGRAKEKFLTNTRELEYYEVGELYGSQFDNYFNKKKWLIKKD